MGLNKNKALVVSFLADLLPLALAWNLEESKVCQHNGANLGSVRNGFNVNIPNPEIQHVI